MQRSKRQKRRGGWGDGVPLPNPLRRLGVVSSPADPWLKAGFGAF